MKLYYTPIRRGCQVLISKSTFLLLSPLYVHRAFLNLSSPPLIFYLFHLSYIFSRSFSNVLTWISYVPLVFWVVPLILLIKKKPPHDESRVVLMLNYFVKHHKLGNASCAILYVSPFTGVCLLIIPITNLASRGCTASRTPMKICSLLACVI